MKGLFFLYHFSETGTASSIQNIRFTRGISDIGVNFDIVTKHDAQIPDNSHAIKIKSRSTKLLDSILLRIFPDLKNLPDLEFLCWTKRVKKQIEKLANINSYDWLHTTGTPHSVHFIGLFLKKKYKIPWVAQFYDPWSDNNFRKFIFKAFKKIDSNLELKIAKNADCIIHSNRIVFEKWEKRYGNIVKNKMFILPFCTDEKINNSNYLDSQSTKKIIMHAGAIYDSRPLDDIIGAIQILLKTNPEIIEEKLEIHLVGYVAQSEQIKIKNSNLERFFQILGRKPYDNILEMYQKVDYLLLIDNYQTENVFFPSKLCEYFSQQKNIIGIVPQKSEAHFLLTDSKHIVVEPHNTKGLAEQMQNLLIGTKNTFEKGYYKNFIPKDVANKYFSKLKEKLKIN